MHECAECVNSFGRKTKKCFKLPVSIYTGQRNRMNQNSDTFAPEELQEMAETILSFCEILCFVPPAKGFYEYQKPLALAIIRDVIGDLGNSLTGLYARQSGKSETVANIAAALMVILPKLANLRDEKDQFIYPQLRKFVRGLWVGIFSPSTTQSSTTYKRLRQRLTSRAARDFLDTEEFSLEPGKTIWPPEANTSTYIELPNGSSCLMMSADKQSNIESKTFQLILLDESQDLDDMVVNKSIMPMAAHYHGTTVATGTPGTTKGYFYNMIKTNEREEVNKRREDWRLQPTLHFENNYKVVQREVKDYRKYIQKEKKRIGEESDEFQMAYNLKWLLERGMAVPEMLFDELTRKHLNIKTEFKEQELVAGLDWGKSQDSTVLTIGRPLWDQVDEAGKAPVEVIYWWDKLGDNYEELFAEVKGVLEKFTVRTLAVDATGTGEPLADRLIWELPYITVIPVKFSAQSKDHLYKWFLMMLQEKKCWWPGDSRVRERKYWKNFKDQMTNLVKEYKGQYLACHAPEDQKNAHDDFPDSLALMLWCINAEAMPFVQVDNADWYHGHNWHKEPTGFSLRG